MKQVLLLAILLYPICCISQTKHVTAQDVINAINKPQWSTKVTKYINYGENTTTLHDSTLITWLVAINDYPLDNKSNNIFDDKHFDAILIYLNNNTGKLITTFKVPIHAIYNDWLDTIMYYPQFNNIFCYNQYSRHKRLIATFPGYRLNYLEMNDSVLFVRCVGKDKQLDCPFFAINKQTGIVTKIANNVPGKILGISSGVLVVYYNGFTFGFDITTFKTLWKIDHTYFCRSYADGKTYSLESNPINFSTSWRLNTAPPNTSIVQFNHFTPDPNYPMLKASDSLSNSEIQGAVIYFGQNVFLKGNSISFSKTIHYNDKRHERYFSITMDIHTGKILDCRETTGSYSYHGNTLNRNHQAPRPDTVLNNSLIIINTPTDSGKLIRKQYLTNIINNPKGWKYDITNYFADSDICELREPPSYIYGPNVHAEYNPMVSEAKDSDELYISVNSYLWCFKAKSGQLLWHKNIKGFEKGMFIISEKGFLLITNYDDNYMVVINKNNPNDIKGSTPPYRYIINHSYSGKLYAIANHNRILKINIPE